MLNSERFWAAMGQNLIFSAIILAIQIPLGIFIALNMPRKGCGADLPVADGAASLIPWNVVGPSGRSLGTSTSP